MFMNLEWIFCSRLNPLTVIANLQLFWYNLGVVLEYVSHCHSGLPLTIWNEIQLVIELSRLDRQICYGDPLRLEIYPNFVLWKTLFVSHGHSLSDYFVVQSLMEVLIERIRSYLRLMLFPKVPTFIIIFIIIRFGLKYSNNTQL